MFRAHPPTFPHAWVNSTIKISHLITKSVQYHRGRAKCIVFPVCFIRIRIVRLPCQKLILVFVCEQKHYFPPSFSAHYLQIRAKFRFPWRYHRHLGIKIRPTFDEVCGYLAGSSCNLLAEIEMKCKAIPNAVSSECNSCLLTFKTYHAFVVANVYV